MVKNITIVSLSSGVLGEPFVRHELDIGMKRLEAYGAEMHYSARRTGKGRYQQAGDSILLKDLKGLFTEKNIRDIFQCP